MTTASKSQIDLLGTRLREDGLSESDLEVLDSYRRSFGEAHEVVVRTIREHLHLEPTGRPAKSTTSIKEKLLRESIRLSQIQDIAGCRIVVEDVFAQDRVVSALQGIFPGCSILDRREKPSHMYRAVHLVVESLNKHVEIQVRSALQHLWAELSEQISDKSGQDLKHGQGDEVSRRGLRVIALFIALLEEVHLISTVIPTEQFRFEEILGPMKSQLTEMLDDSLSKFKNPGGG